MNVRPRDTDEKAEQVQLELLRRLSPQRRVEMTAQLSEDVRAIARAGIRTRHPEYTDEQVRHALFRLLYGEELFRRVWPGIALVSP
jgi:hypothetical protein